MMMLEASDGLWPNADILRGLETEIATFLLFPIILDHLLSFRFNFSPHNGDLIVTKQFPIILDHLFFISVQFFSTQWCLNRDKTISNNSGSFIIYVQFSSTQKSLNREEEKDKSFHISCISNNSGSSCKSCQILLFGVLK